MSARVALGSLAAFSLSLQGCGNGNRATFVGVELYGETGCPYTQAFIKGPVNTAMLKLADTGIMSFIWIPFGQAYYDTPDTLCGAGKNVSEYTWGGFWVGYNVTQKNCFDAACGAYADVPRDASCFTGPLHCQHGGAECAVNAIQGCVMNLTDFNWQLYLPFVVCMENVYSSISAAENYTVINETVKACAHTMHVSTEEVLQCFYTEKEVVLEAMARWTIPHGGVPYVRIVNKTGEFFLPTGSGDDNALVKAVCDAWVYNGGDAPTACDVKTVVV